MKEISNKGAQPEPLNKEDRGLARGGYCPACLTWLRGNISLARCPKCKGVGCTVCLPVTEYRICATCRGIGPARQPTSRVSR